jgi:hypothetical protein
LAGLENVPPPTHNGVFTSRTDGPFHVDQARVSTFEHHRTEIWRANRHLVFGCFAAIALLAIVVSVLNMPVQLSWTAATLTAGLVAVTIIRIVAALNVLYRCPHCGVLPYRTLHEYKCGGLGPTRANFMSPRACPHCGTRIR